MARFDFTIPMALEEHQRTLDALRTAQKLTKCMCAVYCSLGGNVFAVTKRTEAGAYTRPLLSST